MATSLNELLERINAPQAYHTTHKILIYGPSGVGKTTLYDGAKDSLILDVEEGTIVLTKREEMMKNGSRILQLKSWEDLQGVFELLQSGQLHFTNIIMDSITEIQELCKDYILRTQSRKRVSDDTPSQQDWGVLTEKMRKMLRNFRAIDANIIYIARERIDKAEDTGEERIRPDVAGKLQNDLPGAMDVTGYMTSKEGTRFMGFNLQGKYLAKDRTHRLPDIMENPTWDKLEEALPELVPAEMKQQETA